MSINSLTININGILRGNNLESDLVITKSLLIETFYRAILYLLLAFVILYAREFGAVILIILGLFYFFTKKAGLEVLVILTFIYATNSLEFANVDELPFIKIMPGMRLNGIDLLVLPLSIRSFIQIRNKKLSTDTGTFVIFWILLSFTYTFINFILTGSPKEAGTNYLRVLYYISFYFVLLNFFSDNKIIFRTFMILGWIVFFSTISQIMEYYQGYRFTLPDFQGMNVAFSEEGTKVFTAGSSRVYLWSRVTQYVFTSLLFFFSYYLVKKQKNYIALIFSMICALTLIIASVRVWLVVALLSIILMVYFQQKKLKVIPKIVFFFLFLFLIVYQVESLTLKPNEPGLLSSLLGRTSSVLNPQGTYGEQDTFSIRLFYTGVLFQKFLESPLWGHGFGIYIYENYYNIDLGIINRLVMFGVVGTLPLILFIFHKIISTLNSIKIVKTDFEKILFISGVTFLIAHLPAYSFQLDFWGGPLIFSVTLMLASIDSVRLNSNK